MGRRVSKQIKYFAVNQAPNNFVHFTNPKQLHIENIATFIPGHDHQSSSALHGTSSTTTNAKSSIGTYQIVVNGLNNQSMKNSQADFLYQLKEASKIFPSLVDQRHH